MLPHAKMAWLSHAGHEDSVLDGFRRRCAAWRVTLERPKVTKGLHPPTCSPSCVGFPRFTPLSDGTRRWAIHGPAALARRPASRPGQTGSPRRTRGGKKPNPQLRGQLTEPNVFGTMIGRVVISDLAPRPPYGKTKLSHLCNKHNRHGKN